MFTGWIVANTVARLRRRDYTIENDLDDLVQRETSNRNVKSRLSRNRLSQIFEKPESNDESQSTDQICQKFAAIQKSMDELKLLLNTKD